MRDADNPIFEEYKEELLNRPLSTAYDEDRLGRLEELTNKLLSRVESLEQKIQDLEKKT